MTLQKSNMNVGGLNTLFPHLFRKENLTITRYLPYKLLHGNYRHLLSKPLNCGYFFEGYSEKRKSKI